MLLLINYDIFATVRRAASHGFGPCLLAQLAADEWGVGERATADPARTRPQSTVRLGPNAAAHYLTDAGLFYYDNINNIVYNASFIPTNH